MKPLKLLSRPLEDDSIPVQALLYPDEVLIASQGDVGVYDGNAKSPGHQDGVVWITSHRLFWVDKSSIGGLSRRRGTSFYVELQNVMQSDYYAGFLKSSPKIIIQFNPPRSTRSRTISTPALSTTLLSDADRGIVNGISSMSMSGAEQGAADAQDDEEVEDTWS